MCIGSKGRQERPSQIDDTTGYIENTTVRSNRGLQDIKEKIVEHQLRWFGHVSRMPKDKSARLTYQTPSERAKKKDRRPRGRPGKTE
ncbi:unnamed protein product [Nezara viridula]|uniref:Uncharacterized protein n=1 Tax=Nezara viridula TaxID=85310 RepID=A0A9P0H8G6_NEZVI|nr:unnamed protein product [Nezara viridula]